MNNTDVSIYISNIGKNSTHEYSSDIKVLIELPIIFCIICCLSIWAYRDYKTRLSHENKTVVINYKHSNSPGCIKTRYCGFRRYPAVPGKDVSQPASSHM